MEKNEDTKRNVVFVTCTQEQYDEAKAKGNINEHYFYLVINKKKEDKEDE